MSEETESLGDVAREIEELFERRADHDLLDRATSVWPPRGSAFTPEHAEIARFARVVAYRYRRDEADVWQQRAIAAALGSGNTASLALSMQLYCYRAVDEERFIDAHRVLDHMEHLSGLPSEGDIPAPDLVQRILAERRAFALLVEERWEEAVEWYTKALEVARARGRAKVEGGLILARWLAGGPDDEAEAGFSDLVARSSGWPDVYDAATANLDAVRKKDRSATVPFDMV